MTKVIVDREPSDVQCDCGYAEVEWEHATGNQASAFYMTPEDARKCYLAMVADAPSVDEVVGVLEHARCPDPSCDNKGTITVEVQGTTTGTGCCGNTLPSGECCGNPVPVPEPYADIEPAPCQWCHERDALLTMLRGE